jgi:hypothetical protein
VNGNRVPITWDVQGRPWFVCPGCGQHRQHLYLDELLCFGMDAMERVVPWPALCGLIEPYYDDQPELIEITKGAAASDVGGVIAAARCTRSPRSFSCP